MRVRVWECECVCAWVCVRVGGWCLVAFGLKVLADRSLKAALKLQCFVA